MTIRDLGEEILTTKSILDIASAYTEISSMRLRKIRKQTEQSRSFYEDLSKIYALLHYLEKNRPGKAGSRGMLAGNGRTVALLIASNYHFYGKVTFAAGKLFMKYTGDNPCDQIVIGKVGAEFLKSQHYAKSYNVFLLKKDIPNHQELRELINQVKNYQKVIVVYCQFKTILSQVAKISDLSQTQNETIAQILTKKPHYAFILEPEIQKMLDFFDLQIKSVLLSAIFLETELARVASRLVTMDQAQNNANEILKKQNQQLIFAKRTLFNKKTLETWAAIRGRLDPRRQYA